MRFKNLAFLSVVSIVIIAGCTGSGSTSNVAFSQTAGAVINDFSFSSKDVFENDSVQLTLSVQNVGAKNMTDNSQVWVYGPNIDTTNTNSAQWRNTSGVLQQTLSTTGFLPPDVARKIPGSLDIETIDLSAPGLGLAPGMTQDATFHARLCYPYSTTSYTTITAVSKNELRISNPQTSEAITRATAGPIQMTLLSGDTVILGRDLMLVFDITNVGGGFSTTQNTACSSQVPDVSFSDIDKVNVTVTVDGAASTCTDKVVNVKSGKGAVSCKFTPPSSSSPSVGYLVKSSATYNYFVTKDATITVKSSQ